jgi:hypothetical protein
VAAAGRLSPEFNSGLTSTRNLTLNVCQCTHTCAAPQVGIRPQPKMSCQSRRCRSTLGADKVPVLELPDVLWPPGACDRLVTVRWAGRDASVDMCIQQQFPLELLANCKAALFAFKLATGRTLPRPTPLPPAACAAALPPLPPWPTGYLLNVHCRLYAVFMHVYTVYVTLRFLCILCTCQFADGLAA